MTHSIHLGTKKDKQEVLEIVASVGFNVIFQEDHNTPYHSQIQDLRLQIHDPCYFHYLCDGKRKTIDGIITEIEFNDCANKFPHHPEALEVLRRLYHAIPDLKYLISFKGWDEERHTEPDRFYRPLSEFFENPLEYL